MKNDSQTVWNENKCKSEKQRRLADQQRNGISAENDLRLAEKAAAIGNDQDFAQLIYGQPGEYPAFE